jgi:hypothetical protein
MPYGCSGPPHLLGVRGLGRAGGGRGLLIAAPARPHHLVKAPAGRLFFCFAEPMRRSPELRRASGAIGRPLSSAAGVLPC